jgi:hypothetical protein
MTNESIHKSGKRFYNLKQINFLSGLWIGFFIGATSGMSAFVLVYKLFS